MSTEETPFTGFSTASDGLIHGIDGIAAFLRTHPKTVRMLIAEGMPVAEVGLHHTASPRQLVRWIEDRAAAKAAARVGAV